MTITLVLGNNAAVLRDSDPFLCHKKSLSSVTIQLFSVTIILALRNSDVVYNSVLEVDTFIMYLYP